MKVNEMFFWALLLAYEEACQELSLRMSAYEAETFFYRFLNNGFFRLQSCPFKEKYLVYKMKNYQILKDVIKESELVDLSIERVENEGG
jgi:hypothetical protein